MTTALKLVGASANRGSVPVLWDIDLEIATGELVTLVGANGAGKTTLIRAIAGTETVTAGEVQLGGEVVTNTSYVSRMKNGLAWAPEGRQIFGQFTARENMFLSARMVGCDRPTFAERLEGVLEVFPPLKRRLDTRASELSGGEQQMLSIGRTMVRAPNLVLLDEPSSGLAPVVVMRLAAAVTHFHELGIAVLVAEQNVGWLAALEGRAYMIRGGRIIASGGMELLSSSTAVRAAYLGDVA